LRRLYEDEKKSSYKIAEIFNCCQATIWKRLHEFEIKPRKPWELYAKIPSKEFLEKTYVKKRLSTWEIEKRSEYNRGTIHKYLKKYGIRTRDLTESHIIYPRKSFSGDLVEKAYMFGFALGDLRVRNIGQSIFIECGTTKQEQIGLIYDLFKDYGHVWISKPNKKGARNIGAGLDMSFKFLLKKSVGNWITDDRDCFFSFLAGFTDAEGHFGIYNNQARFGIGNYDRELLMIIHNTLKRFGIESRKPYTDRTKGYVKRGGYKHNDNYTSLYISRKSEIKKIFSCLGPHLRHRKKIRDLNKAKMNVKERDKLFGD
jgi:hypothetical protein